jgi:hypothetical protein
MHRVFTHLRLPTGPSIHGEKRFFFEKPGLSHFGRDEQQQAKQQKIRPNQPGVARDSFFLFSFSLFIYLFY